MFFSYLLLRWCNSCWCVNRRGFERLDASHGLKVFLPSEDLSSSFVARPQPPPVSVLFNVAVVSVDPIACMCCLYVLHLPSLNYFLFASQSSGRSCCLLVMLALSPRPSLHCLLSPPLSSPSILLLACVARPQQPPVCLPFAVAAAFLSVDPVAFMYCPSPATARLSWKILR